MKIMIKFGAAFVRLMQTIIQFDSMLVRPMRMTIQWGSMPMRPMQTIIQAIAMRARPMQIMKKNISIAVLCSLLICGNSAFAQRDRNKSLILSEENGWEYEVKAGVNIGGASPLPLPVEIRDIKSYSPKLNGLLEGSATKWFGNDYKWGVSAGLRLEEKGMETAATVKSYQTEIVNEGEKVAGYWTGDVNTNYKSSFVSLPILANYRFNPEWKVRAGLYVSYRMDGEFSGFVSDGYLREGTPIGEKISFTDGKTATYDFTSQLRRFLWGTQLGGSWRAFKHFSVTADLTWAFNNIFEADFKTISFNMYPIYLNVGFAYRF